MKRALITGINGFVGSYLKTELETHGYEVFGLGREENSALTERYIAADVTHPEQVTAAMQRVAPTHVFHLAGISLSAEIEANPEAAIAIGTEGTTNILKAATLLKEPPRVLLVSSAHVYGKPEYLPLDEEHPLRGTSPYALSKIGLERAASAFRDQLFIAVARSFNHTGPGQSDAFVIPMILKQIAEMKHGRRQALEVKNINTTLDLTSVRDVVGAYRLLLEQDISGVTCNVCRGEPISLKEVIRHGTLIAALPSEPAVVSQDTEPIEFYGDRSYLHQLTGWQSQVSYRELFEEMYRSFE